MHTHSFDLYLHLSQLIPIHNTHILINQWEFKKIKHRFFFNATKKIKILSIPPHFKHKIILNVEIKEKKYKIMTKIK
jgi:hypothetical protein